MPGEAIGKSNTVVTDPSAASSITRTVAPEMATLAKSYVALIGLVRVNVTSSKGFIAS